MLKIGFLGSCKMGTVGVRSPGDNGYDDDDVHREGEAAKVNGGPATPH